MPPPAAALREVHRLRRHAKNLTDELERLPRMIKALEAKVSRHEDSLKQAHDKITKLKLTTRDREKTLKSTHEQLAKYQKQLDTVATKKEMDALQVEIAHAKESGRKLEDEILTIMDEAEQLAAKVPELDKALKQAKDELANSDQMQKERHAALTQELTKTQEELQTAEALLPEDIKVQYDRLVAYRGEDALSVVHGRNCNACNTEITAQMHNNLLQGLFVLCKSCGRILYHSE